MELAVFFDFEQPRRTRLDDWDARVDNLRSAALALDGDISRATYILVAPLQEVLGKSAMYYSFELCFDRAHPHLANGLCAVTFALFHAVYGPRMMLLAALLSLVTGWLFQKYRCVWGCSAVHFALGFLPPCFGF